MTSSQLDALRKLKEDAEKSKQRHSEEISLMLQAMIERQKQFDQDQERIRDDIKRGARLSRGKIPH